MFPTVYCVHVVQGCYGSHEIQCVKLYEKKNEKGSPHCLALIPGMHSTCSELCSLTPLSPASAEAIFLAASTFPSAQRSVLTVSWCSVLQQESSRTTGDVSLWSLATPWRVLPWWEIRHTRTHPPVCSPHPPVYSTSVYTLIVSYADIGWCCYCWKVHYKVKVQSY